MTEEKNRLVVQSGRVSDPKNFSHVIKDGKIMAKKGVITCFSSYQKIELN